VVTKKGSSYLMRVTGASSYKKQDEATWQWRTGFVVRGTA